MTPTKKLFVPLMISAMLSGAPPTASAAVVVRHFRDHDIHRFHEHDIVVWRTGRWRHVWHGGHLGWWWVVGSLWYPYVQPIYPYPDPYIPSTVIVQQPPTYVQQQPAPPPAPAAAPAQPQAQYWYYCEQSKGYYPYVRDCPAGWKSVPAEPPPNTPGTSP
ncbi:MAG TPA: hypothetical protein VMH34_00045 [Gammaproteobacteria bacterium]|nr:hypothetical protein [Gammaproteobacteria bacterium]